MKIYISASNIGRYIYSQDTIRICDIHKWRNYTYIWIGYESTTTSIYFVGLREILFIIFYNIWYIYELICFYSEKLKENFIAQSIKMGNETKLVTTFYGDNFFPVKIAKYTRHT